MSQLPPNVIIQRRPLDTSPSARLNSYNHHALAPWLSETGYLTPQYLFRREKEITPFNMGRWLSPQIQEFMLDPPVAIHNLSKNEVRKLLEIASETNYDTRLAEKNESIALLAKEMDTRVQGLDTNPPRGYFIRMSHCSPKDADGGNLEAVFDMHQALVKLVVSKRTVQALLTLFYSYSATEEVADNQLYFFPYYTGLDRLSEWRCYINNDSVVAISQSRFYQPNHPGISDEALQSLAAQVHQLWSDISPGLDFKSCVLDVYAEVTKPGFSVKLIEVNPWGAHLGSGSLLFHWLDDADILEPQGLATTTVVRLVKEGESRVLTRDEAYRIGRDGIIDGELRSLQARGLEWILNDEQQAEFMALPLPDGHSGLTTRRDGVELFRNHRCGTSPKPMPRDHPRFLKLQKAYKNKVGSCKV